VIVGSKAANRGISNSLQGRQLRGGHLEEVTAINDNCVKADCAPEPGHFQIRAAFQVVNH
jgi:hypothetical protein